MLQRVSTMLVLGSFRARLQPPRPGSGARATSMTIVVRIQTRTRIQVPRPTRHVEEVAIVRTPPRSSSDPPFLHPSCVRPITTINGAHRRRIHSRRTKGRPPHQPQYRGNPPIHPAHLRHANLPLHLRNHLHLRHLFQMCLRCQMSPPHC
jgi:hypothetical protein